MNDQTGIKEHVLNLTNRSKGSPSGVNKVISACDSKLTLVQGGAGLIIEGEKLRILQFNETTGMLAFEGSVAAIKYGAAHKSLLRRIFK